MSNHNSQSAISNLIDLNESIRIKKSSSTKRLPAGSLADAVDDVLSSISDQGCGDMELIDDRGLVEQRMGGAAPVEVSVLAAASQPRDSMSSTTSTGGQSPRRSATAPDPPSPRRSGNNVAPAAATDVVLSALSSSPPSNSNSITSMSSGSSSSHRSSSPVGNAAERSPQPSRNNVFRQYFRGRQRRPADSPALPAAGNNSNGFSSPAPGSPVVGGGGGGGGSPVKASPPSNGTGANTGAGGGAWHQRLAAWRKNKRDSLGSNNLKAKPSSSANAGSGETFAVSDADAGDSALDPNRRTTIWCVGDLVVNVSIGRKSTIPELRDCLAASAKSADFELPPSFVLAVERDRSIVLLSELFSPATLPFEMDTQFLVDGVEFRYLVLPEKFELFEADAVD